MSRPHSPRSLGPLYRSLPGLTVDSTSFQTIAAWPASAALPFAHRAFCASILVLAVMLFSPPLHLLLFLFLAASFSLHSFFFLIFWIVSRSHLDETRHCILSHLHYQTVLQTRGCSCSVCWSSQSLPTWSHPGWWARLSESVSIIAVSVLCTPSLLDVRGIIIDSACLMLVGWLSRRTAVCVSLLC